MPCSSRCSCSAGGVGRDTGRKCGDAEADSLPSGAALIATLPDLLSIVRHPTNTAAPIVMNETAAMPIVWLAGFVCAAVASCVGGGVSTAGCVGDGLG
jgi:hypothetical protein